MERLLIEGLRPLQGEVRIEGAKNAALAVIPAALLANGICRIENLPNISDIQDLKLALESIGAQVSRPDDSTLIIDSREIETTTAVNDSVRRIRASYYLLGSLLGRYKEAAVSMPGGCNFGSRPIDQHIKGFEALGAQVNLEHGIINVQAKELKGTTIYMDVVSVGATINLMLASVLAEGVTVLENPAKEPHVVDVANFLNAMGADVKGAGTDVIRIKGVETLHGCTYAVIPDQIEAGTYLIAGAITKGDVTVTNVIPKHLESITAKLVEMGVEVIEEDDSVRVIGKENYKGVNVKTLPYPGFPTDMQPQMTVLLAIAKGTSMVTESVWDNRFQYVDEIMKMGAKIMVQGRNAIVEGIPCFSGASVTATDLRAGAAMVLAGLAAEGVTEVCKAHLVNRGYQDIVGKLRGLGAKIERVSS